MFKKLNQFTVDETNKKEVTSMRKDLPLPAELTLRERMCSAILIEYATTLLQEGKSYSDVRQLVMEEAGKLSTDHYIPSTFVVKVLTDLNTFFSKRESRKNKIKNRFFAHKDTQTALKKFSDPNISKEAATLSSGMEKLELSGISEATAEAYMTEVVELMKQKTSIPYDFFYS